MLDPKLENRVLAGTTLQNKINPSHSEYNLHFCFVYIRQSPIKEQFRTHFKSTSGESPENYFVWWWFSWNARGCLHISVSDLTTVENSSWQKAPQWFCGNHETTNFTPKGATEEDVWSLLQILIVIFFLILNYDYRQCEERLYKNDLVQQIHSLLKPG